MNREFSFGSQMKLDLPSVTSIIESLINSIKEENKDANNEVSITIKRKIDGKIFTIFALKKVSFDQVASLKKLLPEVVYLLVKDANPTSIYYRYSISRG